ncbi:hypothetical protein PCH_Pc12g14610 [Penicillium rubens Wisconsin 54-1255]|uniref:Uncharacterized protein n=1 Tax=Penicillium rubens (strain ATCC 28089 / DSM 1075 / NRRL 1951 / Wisconsin 54-1255) TaxID=500485 RepID=B6H131_PENRW|nr:hypothetical protein PCH_Pc12g14610 [Penicillium rubens Wisconsin 54-1255]
MGNPDPGWDPIRDSARGLPRFADRVNRLKAGEGLDHDRMLPRPNGPAETGPFGADEILRGVTMCDNSIYGMEGCISFQGCLGRVARCSAKSWEAVRRKSRVRLHEGCPIGNGVIPGDQNF